jgi:Phosphatidylinositol-4-phosphate 5-Kinase
MLYVDLINEKRFFHLGPKKADLMKQISNDAHFLAELNIMDYSLLVLL